MTNGDLGAMAESKAGASTVFVSQVQKTGKFAKASCGEFDPFDRPPDRPRIQLQGCLLDFQNQRVAMLLITGARISLLSRGS